MTPPNSLRLAGVLAVLSAAVLLLSLILLAVSGVLVMTLARESMMGSSAAPAASQSSGAAARVLSSATLDRCRTGAWLQSTANAAAWKRLGVDCLIGQWDAVTAEDQALLNAADMPLMVEPGDSMSPGSVPAGATSLVFAWLTPHEPDLSQDGIGGPATPPETVISQAQAIKDVDPDRPVMVYLSMGVAIPGWFGMGSDSGRWEDYYRKIVSSPAVDLIAFDYYPWNVGAQASVNGSVEPDPQFVVDAVKRLKEWSEGKAIYATLASSQINEKYQVPTLELTRDLVTKLLDAGADGIIWFGHDFTDGGEYIRDAHPLSVTDGSAEMVNAINEQVKRRFG